VFVLQKYGPIEACLTGAGVFSWSRYRGRAATSRARTSRARARPAAAETRKSAVHSALADPMLVAAGIQVIRAIGIKKLIPILAVADWRWDFS